MSCIATHYERLGVRPDADASQIRDAYRTLARIHHPDANNGRSSDRAVETMAAINEAYRVLSDPGRRLDYDRSLRAGATGAPTGSAAPAGPGRSASPEPRLNPIGRYSEPPRFPWRFVLIIVVLGSAAVLLVGAFTQPGEPAAVDNVLRPGDCVVIEPTTAVVSEVRCDETHDAVVEALVPFDGHCASDVEPFRDRQGMGIACVRRI